MVWIVIISPMLIHTGPNSWIMVAGRQRKLGVSTFFQEFWWYLISLYWLYYLFCLAIKYIPFSVHHLVCYVESLYNKHVLLLIGLVSMHKTHTHTHTHTHAHTYTCTRCSFDKSDDCVYCGIWSHQRRVPEEGWGGAGVTYLSMYTLVTCTYIHVFLCWCVHVHVYCLYANRHVAIVYVQCI